MGRWLSPALVNGAALGREIAGSVLADPKVAIDDSAGLWEALRQVFLVMREPRCWVRNTVSALDKLPKRLLPEAKQKQHVIWVVALRAHGARGCDLFVAKYEAK